MPDPTDRRATPKAKAAAVLRERMATLPLPLAQLVLRALNGKSPADRHHAAFYLAECTLKLAASARVGLWMERAIDPSSDLARKLEALVLPSLGHWCEILRELVTALSKRADVALFPPLCAAAELTKKRPEWSALADLAKRGVEEGALADEATRQSLRRGALGFFEILVAYRNAVIGHGAQRTASFYEEFARLLLDAIAVVLAEPSLFGGMELAQARLSADGEAGRITWYALTGLAGLAREADGAPDATGATPGHLYLVGAGARVPLHPLVVYRREDELDREQIGFLNRTARRRDDAEIRSVEYLDYASGQTLDGMDARAAMTALLAKLRGRDVTPADVDDVVAKTRAGATAPPESEPAKSGAIIGDFEIAAELGRGSMGVVYQALQRSLGRTVALKVLPPALAADPVAHQRFKKEMIALARCDHPNVVRILATGADADRAYYAMEHVDGNDLAHATFAIEKWRAELGPRDFGRRLAELFADAADGLAHLHDAGVIHRDLKPGNLMLSADGKRLVIMDLGLAKLADESRALTSADVKILGTLRYMAPEQLQSRLAPVDARADVYGLGAALYEVATGRPVHDGDTEARLLHQVLTEDPAPPRRARPDLPVDLATVIETCLARLPGQRYARARALAEDLRAVAEDRPIRARPAGIGRKLGLFARRRRAAIAGVGIALAVGAIGGVVVWDRDRLKITYYANVVDRRGVFEGVAPLSGPDGRSMTRKLLRKGGRVVAVECVNGRGALGSLADCGAFSSAELHYADDGRVAYRIERGPTGRFLAKYVYAYKDDRLQIVRQDRNDLPQPDAGDVAMYRYEFDERGFRRKSSYFSDRGSPRPSFGVYGYEQTNDEHGQPIALVFLDDAGSPLVRTDGVTRATITWDSKGNEVARAYFAADGRPAANSDGAAGTRQTVDEHGNVIERVYLGVDGKPTRREDGVARWRARYDEAGCQIERALFGPDDRPARSKLGYASFHAKCDERGREIERAYFGLSGEATRVQDGYSIVRFRFDDRNAEVERAFFGVDGLPITNTAGAAILRTRYDERENPVEVSAFGVDGRPTLTKAGHATVRRRYDDRDIEVETAYLGVDGRPIVAADGCATIRVRHDDRGKETERTCFGEGDRPRLSPEGWAIVRTGRDDRGNPIERSYFDAAGRPVLTAGGFAIERSTYDARDDEIERRYLGKAGEPVLRSGGYSSVRMRHDEMRKVVETTYFDLEGHVVPAPP
ncbi:MAG: serine/threonine-protein kinase [Polyangiaceae bacterium]